MASKLPLCTATPAAFRPQLFCYPRFYHSNTFQLFSIYRNMWKFTRYYVVLLNVTRAGLSESDAISTTFVNSLILINNVSIRGSCVQTLSSDLNTFRKYFNGTKETLLYIYRLNAHVYIPIVENYNISHIFLNSYHPLLLDPHAFTTYFLFSRLCAI